MTLQHFIRSLQLKTVSLVGTTLIISSLFCPALATNYQSHSSIQHTAKMFMAQHIKQNYTLPATITINRLDNRLRLKQCNQPLTAFRPEGSRDIGRTTVGVKCDGSQPWSLQIPITVSMMKTIAVAAELLPRGKLLSKNDIRMKKIDLATLPQGYIDNINNLVGLKLKRRLAADVAFTPAMIEKPQRIKRGQRITIVARSGSMEVRMSGKALSGGAVGDRIQVINIASKLHREGVITAQGEVQVNL